MWTTDNQRSRSGASPADAARPKPLPADRRTGHRAAGRAVGSLLAPITSKSFERFGFHSAEIFMAWPTVAGPELASKCVPERLKWPRTPSETDDGAGHSRSGSRPGGDGATLILRTEPAHALEIEYRAGEIADRLNRYFGYRAIARVKVLQAPLPNAPAARQATPAADQQTDAASATAAPLESNLPDDVKTALEGLWRQIVSERARR